MIDTHCHLTYDGIIERVDAVIADAAAAGVDRMISVGTTPADALRALDLTHRFPGVYATAGVHPHHANSFTDKRAVVEPLLELMREKKMVAIGEMGLDRHYPDPPIEDQRRVLEWQLEVATTAGGAAAGKPIVIHNREATDDTLAMLRASGIPSGRFIFHCFTGSAAELDAILAFGATVGFTGIVTFKSAAALADASLRVPLDRLLIETDSPYLTPEPHRRVKINEPRYVADVARFLAQKRNLPLHDFVAAVDANATRLFRV